MSFKTAWRWRMRFLAADPRPKCGELFAGVGGIGLGFARAGHDVVIATEMAADAIASYKRMHPGVPVVAAPIEKITGRTLMRAAGLVRGELDILVGGPPCQPHSVANKWRDPDDPRAAPLIDNYLRLVTEIQPRACLLENVVGIKSTALDRVIKGFRDLGYAVEYATLDAADFGVPQHRRRVFVVARRDGRPIRFPAPTHGPGRPAPWQTVADAFDGLPDEPDETIPDHIAHVLGTEAEERIALIGVGQSWRDLPELLMTPGMRRMIGGAYGWRRYGRMAPDKPSTTLTCKADPHSGQWLHPYAHRTITIREAARLQSFPDIALSGSVASRYRQLGNAVPPLLAEAVARALLL